jgi:hypothetical protein
MGTGFIYKMQNAIEAKCDEVQTSLPKRAKAIPWTCRSSFHLGWRVRDRGVVELIVQKSNTGTVTRSIVYQALAIYVPRLLKMPTFDTHRPRLAAEGGDP